jgi:hypothetical protein
MLEVCRLKNQLKSHILSWKSKIILCNVLIRPVLTCTSQTWASDEEALAIFEKTVPHMAQSKTIMIGELDATMNCTSCLRVWIL